MIDGKHMVDELARAGCRLFTGTPCSFLTPLINTVIDADGIDYVAAANEGDAVAIAAGSELGGRPAVVMFQNSGLGNAVNPLTSLTDTFRVPMLIVVTWRGQPDRPADEPQHALMGAITPRLLDLMNVPWEIVPHDASALPAVVDRAWRHTREERTPFALLLEDDTIAPYKLRERNASEQTFALRSLPNGELRSTRHPQDEVLRSVQKFARPSDVIVTTTGYTGRALYALDDRANQFYMVGSMGCASSFALGLAKSQPRRRIVVLDGDGALLMRMGALATLGRERPPNLLHVLLDNSVHDSTGGQPTGSEAIDFAAIAAACGYPRVVRTAALEQLHSVLAEDASQLTFVHLRTEPRSCRKLPRPEVSPSQIAERLRQWMEVH